MNKHYINEVGSDLVLDTGILVGSAGDQSIHYKKPDGLTTGSFAADLYSSYSSIAAATGTYLLKHTLESGDFDTAGDWTFQAFVAAVDGTWLGESVTITVYDNFQ